MYTVQGVCWGNCTVVWVKGGQKNDARNATKTELCEWCLFTHINQPCQHQSLTHTLKFIWENHKYISTSVEILQWRQSLPVTTAGLWRDVNLGTHFFSFSVFSFLWMYSYALLVALMSLVFENSLERWSLCRHFLSLDQFNAQVDLI